MSLNIKNPEAHELAQELASVTGQTMTQAVIGALQETLERKKARRKKATAEELLAIGRNAAAKLKGKPIDHAEFHYNDQGFFK